MIDLTKPLTTRDGREVRIYAQDGGTGFPVLGAVKSEANQGRPAHWNLQRWTFDGRFYATDLPLHPCDLINPSARIHRTVWLNLYPETTTTHIGAASARVAACAGRLACIKVELDCVEGEGL